MKMRSNQIFIKHYIGVVNIDIEEHISFAKLPSITNEMLNYSGSPLNKMDIH